LPIQKNPTSLWGGVSYESNLHDNHALPKVLFHIENNRGKAVKHAVCDRGYRGKEKFGNTDIIYLRQR